METRVNNYLLKISKRQIVTYKMIAYYLGSDKLARVVGIFYIIIMIAITSLL